MLTVIGILGTISTIAIVKNSGQTKSAKEKHLQSTNDYNEANCVGVPDVNQCLCEKGLAELSGLSPSDCCPTGQTKNKQGQCDFVAQAQRDPSTQPQTPLPACDYNFWTVSSQDYRSDPEKYFIPSREYEKPCECTGNKDWQLSGQFGGINGRPAPKSIRRLWDLAWGDDVYTCMSCTGSYQDNSPNGPCYKACDPNTGFFYISGTYFKRTTTSPPEKRLNTSTGVCYDCSHKPGTYVSKYKPHNCRCKSTGYHFDSTQNKCVRFCQQGYYFIPGGNPTIGYFDNYGTCAKRRPSIPTPPPSTPSCPKARKLANGNCCTSGYAASNTKTKCCRSGFVGLSCRRDSTTPTTPTCSTSACPHGGTRNSSTCECSCNHGTYDTATNKCKATCKYMSSIRSWRVDNQEPNGGDRMRAGIERAIRDISTQGSSLCGSRGVKGYIPNSGGLANPSVCSNGYFDANFQVNSLCNYFHYIAGGNQNQRKYINCRSNAGGWGFKVIGFVCGP